MIGYQHLLCIIFLYSKTVEIRTRKNGLINSMLVFQFFITKLIN